MMRHPLRNYQVVYSGADGEVVHIILNVETLLLYLTQRYNDWDRLRFMQEVIQQEERLHEHPVALWFEDKREWVEEPGPPVGGKEMDPSAESFGPLRSNPTLGQGDPETEEEVEDSLEEDEPTSCSERKRSLSGP